MPEVSNNNQRFTCSLCGRIFHNKQAFDWHKQEDHDEAHSPPRRER